MKEATDEDLLHIFNVPNIADTTVTSSNLCRCKIKLYRFIILATLIRTYGDTAFILIETVVDVIVSHSPQQQTNKLYMEAMGIIITLFSRMLINVRITDCY